MKPQKSLFSTVFLCVRMHPGARDHWKTTVVHFRLEFPLKRKVLITKKGHRNEVRLFHFSISHTNTSNRRLEGPSTKRITLTCDKPPKKLLIDSNALTYDNEFLLQTYMISDSFFLLRQMVDKKYSAYFWILIKSSTNENVFVCTNK